MIDRARLTDLWQVWLQNFSGKGDVQDVRFYRDENKVRVVLPWADIITGFAEPTGEQINLAFQRGVSKLISRHGLDYPSASVDFRGEVVVPRNSFFALVSGDPGEHFRERFAFNFGRQYGFIGRSARARLKNTFLCPRITRQGGRGRSVIYEVGELDNYVFQSSVQFSKVEYSGLMAVAPILSMPLGRRRHISEKLFRDFERAYINTLLCTVSGSAV